MMRRGGIKNAYNPNVLFCSAVFAAAALWGFKIGGIVTQQMNPMGQGLTPGEAGSLPPPSWAPRV